MVLSITTNHPVPEADKQTLYERLCSFHADITAFQKVPLSLVSPVYFSLGLIQMLLCCFWLAAVFTLKVSRMPFLPGLSLTVEL